MTADFRRLGLQQCSVCQRILPRSYLNGSRCVDRMDCALACGRRWRRDHGEPVPDPELDEDNEAPVVTNGYAKWTVPVNAPPAEPEAFYGPPDAFTGQGELEL